jgi:type 1 fimbria pilin
MRHISTLTRVGLAATLVAAAPAPDSNIRYAQTPQGGAGTITAKGTFVVEPGHRLSKITAYAFNTDEKKPGVNHPLVAGKDFDTRALTFSVTLKAEPGVYLVHFLLEVEDRNGKTKTYNTPTVEGVTVK